MEGEKAANTKEDNMSPCLLGFALKYIPYERN